MCGVFLVFLKNAKKLNINQCKKASKDLFNRGPDYFKFSVFENGSLYISNTILSITESLKGKNIISSQKNFFYFFNGQIYNYQYLKEKYLKNIKFRKYY